MKSMDLMSLLILIIVIILILALFYWVLQLLAKVFPPLGANPAIIYIILILIALVLILNRGSIHF